MDPSPDPIPEASEATSPPAVEVLYEGPHASVAHRVLVSVGAGALLWAMAVFLRWGLGGAEHPVEGTSRAALVSAVVSAAMVVAALRSRAAWRVEIDHPSRSVRVHRDPDVVETFALADLDDVRHEPAVGGWSRDPSERLVLVAKGGATRAFSLPDDAHTPGIVDDIRRARG